MGKIQDDDENLFKLTVCSWMPPSTIFASLSMPIDPETKIKPPALTAWGKMSGKGIATFGEIICSLWFAMFADFDGDIEKGLEAANLWIERQVDGRKVVSSPRRRCVNIL